MEDGIKIVLVILGLLIVAFGVVYLLSGRILNLNKQAELQEDKSSDGFSSMKCILNGGEYYTKQLTCNVICGVHGANIAAGVCAVAPDCCCDDGNFYLRTVADNANNCPAQCTSAKSVVLTNCPSIGAALDICCCRCG